MDDKEEFIPAYEGNDMISFMLERGFKMCGSLENGAIRSITNVRDTAIIVTDYTIWRAKPCYQIGFAIERVAIL